MRIVLVQARLVWRDPAQNRAHLEALMEVMNAAYTRENLAASVREMLNSLFGRFVAFKAVPCLLNSFF